MKRMEDALSKIGLTLIGVCSLLYAMFARHFAQIHIQLPSLDFPIFVGEIVLFVCIILLTVKWIKEPLRFSKWHVCIFIYCAWILFKALQGYVMYGPLAFRNAALFYYPLFFVLGYEFFKKEFFTQKVTILFLLAILTANGLRGLYLNYYYYDFIYWGIYLTLLLNIKDKKLKVLFFLVSFSMLIYQRFLDVSRSTMMAFISVIFFVSFSLGYLIKIRRIYVLAIIILSIILFGLGYLKYGKHSKIKSFLKMADLLEIYKEHQKILDKNKDYQLKEIPVQLYSEQTDTAFNNATLANIKRRKVSISDLKKELQEPVNILQAKYLVKAVEMNRLYSDILTFFSNALSDIEYYKMPKDTVVINLERIIVNRLSEEMTNHENLKVISQQDDFINAMKDIFMNRFAQVLLNKELIDPEDQNVNQSNILFRLYIWRDMFNDLIVNKAFLGMNWGKPLRSRTIEIIGRADSEWQRDGWITPHNSFIHFIYRAGIVGILFIGVMIYAFCSLTKAFIRHQSLKGIIICSVLLYWCMLSNFLVILEFPYNAIPFWSLFGMIWAYKNQISNLSYGKS